MSWCRVLSGPHDQMSVTVWRLCGLSDERSGLSFAIQSLQYLVVCQYVRKYLHFICLTHNVMYIQGLLSVKAQHSITEVEVNLRPTVSRPVCPGVRPPSGTCDQFFLRHEISFRQLRLCYFVAPSLTRGRVCNLLLNCFLALPEQSLPQNSRSLFYCLVWDSPNLEGKVSVFISPRNRVAQLYPRTLGSLSVAFYDSRGLR
jgi:hypothetical protein